MKIIIENCNNIKQGSINIKENHLNIKYGINGTGKSTITKAIRQKVLYVGDLSPLKPFNAKDGEIPKIDIVGNINTLKIYNEDYVSQYLFLSNGENLHKESFEVFVKPENYDQNVEKINLNFKLAKEKVNGNELLENILTQRNELLSILKFNENGSLKKYGLGKALSVGNKMTSDIPEEIKKYSIYFNNKNQNVKWYDWHAKGRPLNIDNICQYCSQDLPENFGEMLTKIDELFDKNNVESLMKATNIFDKIEMEMGAETTDFSKLIIKSNSPINSDNSQKLILLIKELDNLANTISFFKNIDYITLRNIDNVKEEIENKRIKINELQFLKGDRLVKELTEYNKNLDNLLDKITDLIKEFGVLNTAVKNNVNRNLVKINDFLTNAGMDYNVNVVDDKLILNYFNTDIVVNPSEHLSWGEKNCFALSLFLFDCLHQPSDLIILDDPVSSFDTNKKYAILHYLFSDVNSLKGKTVVLLTHDLEPIIDMLLVKNYPSVDCCYIENNRGLVNEICINKTDVDSIINVAKDCFSNKDINIVNRIVHLRRFLELNNSYELEYNMISSLLKGQDIPTIKKDNRDFLPEEISSSEIIISSKYIGGFIYNDVLADIKNFDKMKKMYTDSDNSYEKIEIFRVICRVFKLLNIDDVLGKFIAEAFHIENAYIFQLNPYAYNLVPSYIVEKCDLIINRSK